jgi:predicted RNase H-like HicB family nuclease
MYITEMKAPMKTLQNIVWKEGKGYVSQSLNTGVSSFGDTKAEALKNLEEALDLYFEDEEVTNFSPVERPEIITIVRRA